jgi:hypothetical protein
MQLAAMKTEALLMEQNWVLKAYTEALVVTYVVTKHHLLATLAPVCSLHCQRVPP